MNKDQLTRGKELEHDIGVTERGIERANTKYPMMYFRIKTIEEAKKDIFNCYSEIRKLEYALDDDDVNELIGFMELCGRQFQERVLRMANKSLNRFKKEFEELWVMIQD